MASCKTITFRVSLSTIVKKRHEGCIFRVGLLNPQDAPFQCWYQAKCKASIVTLTGPDFASFNYILIKFKSLYETFALFESDGMIRELSRNPGCSRLLGTEKALELFTALYHTRCFTMIICLLFEIISKKFFVMVWFACHIFLQILQRDNYEAGRMLTAGKFSSLFCKAFKLSLTLLHGVYATLDNLKLQLKQSTDYVIQNMFYTEWTHCYYFTNVLAFAPDETIIACAIMDPGALHDSTVAEIGGVYDKMYHRHRAHGGRIAAESAFLVLGPNVFSNRSNKAICGRIQCNTCSNWSRPLCSSKLLSG